MLIKGPARSLAGVMLTLILTAALVGCSESSEGTAEERIVPSPLGNVDLANTRYIDSSVSAENVTDLEEAWSLPLEAKGEGTGFIGSPIVVNGIVYLQDPDSNVRAVDIGNGQTIWEKPYEAPTRGPNGIIFAGGAIFGATPSNAFALDAETGEEIWSVKLLRNGREKIAMTPGYHDGLVYFATSPAKYEGDEVGVLWALNARTGRKAWHFDTAPRSLWGHPKINFGGGVSHSPAFDGEGSLYIGTGNPGPVPGTEEFPWGSSRPGPNLYTNSIVKLDERTGKVEWHYQVTPHGLCDWDVGAPLLAEANGRKLVIAAGLGGVVIALDRKTGKPIWRRPVGLHNGHDNDGLVAMREEYEKLKLPMAVYPGVFGGVAGPMSLHGPTVFVPVIDNAARLQTQEYAETATESAGHLVALDVATGEVRWEQQFPSPLFGPVIATNDLVFAISFEGLVYAYEASSGTELWREALPSYAEGGISVSGETVLVRASFPSGEEVPQLVAYRLAE